MVQRYRMTGAAVEDGDGMWVKRDALETAQQEHKEEMAAIVEELEELYHNHANLNQAALEMMNLLDEMIRHPEKDMRGGMVMAIGRLFCAMGDEWKDNIGL